VEGILYVRDLLAALATGRKEDAVETVMREAFFVPETKTAAELLKSMQANHVQIAIVIDEYGGVAGLVTVEDIIEEIVGEIEDEDTEQEEIIEIVEGEGGYYDVLGSTEIDNIDERGGTRSERRREASAPRTRHRGPKSRREKDPPSPPQESARTVARRN
jgi:CBS domain containing-hemolysin-like protein